MKPGHLSFGRRLLGLAAVTLLALNMVYAQQPVFRVGILGDERGAVSNGAWLAVEEINNSGGVQGADGTFFRLELITQSTGGGVNLPTAVANLNQSAVIAVLGPEDSNEVLNNLAVLQSLNVPVLTPATGDTILTSDSSGRLVRIRAAEVLQGRALANYVVTDLLANRIATVQLDVDINTTAEVIGFTTAIAALGITPQLSLQAQSDADLPAILTQLAQSNPQLVVIYGDPARAGKLYNDLRTGGWLGDFAYNHADNPAFRAEFAPSLLAGILSTTTWPFTASDEVSTGFKNRYVNTFGAVPGAVEAASYDGIYLLVEAIGKPGDLLTNLSQINNITGVQGLLKPAQLSRGETGTNVSVIELGPFGAPVVLARFESGKRISISEPIATGTPAPTPTPQGVVATITRTVQNVRTGPSTAYDIIGQLNQGDQVQIIGANIDFSWLVIEFRGQRGWISRSILDVFGDLNTLPLITPPPTPTPIPSPTAPPIPTIVIDSVVGSPSPFIVNLPFIVSVSVRNVGAGPAGQFAVAATFPPNNIFSSVIVPGLAPGQSTLVNLTGTFTNTGFYSVVIVGDLNRQVMANPATFNFNYAINKPVLRQGSVTLNAGDSLDLEGTGNLDVTWNAGATALDAVGSARVGVIPNVSLGTIHWDLINASIVNQPTVARTSMNAGTVIGVITADGNRGAIQVVDIPGSQFVISYLVYQN